MPETSTDSPNDVESFMAAVRAVESGGNYQAVGPSTRYGRATGAYQFLDSTWGGYGGYPQARLAPAAIQDARARELMSSYYQMFGSWRAVAVAWHAGPGSARRFVAGTLDLGSIGDVNVSTRTYVDRVMAGMGPGSGQSPTEITDSPVSRLTAFFGDMGMWKRIGMGMIGVSLFSSGLLLLGKDVILEATPVGKAIDVAKGVADAGAD